MDRLNATFADQAGHCTALGSPFMGRLMTLFADRFRRDQGQISQIMFDWPGDVGPKAASLPLRIAGGLHALRLRGDSELAAVYPPNAPSDDALWTAVLNAMDREATFLREWLQSPPQTNELRRSAVLRAAGHWLTDRYAMPLHISELGASAGLNLLWPQYVMRIEGASYGPADAALTLTPDWTGSLPPQNTPQIAAARGVDLAPPNPVTDRLRLLAYLWADQSDRLARTKAALDLPAASVDTGDAIDWLAPRLATPLPSKCHLICHTIAWQYFPADVQTKGRALIEAAGARATADAPLAWFGMEPDSDTRGAALTLRLWPGNLTLNAGRADFHGRWVDWALSP